jgi:DNA-binding IscR family transcriptional regulator
MTGSSPYGTMTDILRADEAILDAAWTAHTVRHQCKAGECDARKALQDGRSRIRQMLYNTTLQDKRPDYTAAARAFDNDDG